jgi:phosphoenolpyruvate-protein kinase (PTS system EI component)
MNDLCVFAQAASQVDNSAVGISITSLLGSLGAAGAAVVVTYYFLGFLRDQGEKQGRLFQDFKEYHAESQRKFQDQLDRLTDRQEQSQRGFQDQVTRITEAQNLLLRDAILAMKAVEKSQDGAIEAIRGIEKTIASLQLTVGAIDSLVRRAVDGRPNSRAETNYDHASTTAVSHPGRPGRAP